MLSRLWFILVVAIFYVTAQGVAGAESDNRQRVDMHWFRGNSYFRIGLAWVKTSFIKGWEGIQSVRFTLNKDPQPAIESRKQHEKRLFKIEFQVQTLVFNAS